MGDLKDIKRWGRKARPHIFALEPRMLFDGVSVAPHDHPNEFISSVKVIDFIDSNISHAIDNQLILNDIKTTVRIDLAESRASLGNIVRLYKDNEENLSAQLGNDYVISDDDIQKGFVDLEIRSFLEDFSQLSAKICEQDDQIHLSEIFDVTQRALGKNDFTNQFNIQDISLIENCYKDHLIDALVRVDNLLNNLPNQLNCEDLFRDLFGAAGTDPTSFAQNMDRLFDRLRSTGLNLNVEFISDAELKGNKAVFAPMQSELTEPTIYINTTWLSLNPSSASIQKTLLEEVGHFFDYELNLGQISNGAAGEIFSYRILGIDINEKQKQDLLKENHLTVLNIKGSVIQVYKDANTPPSLSGEKARLIDGIEDTSYILSEDDLLQGYTDAEGDALSVVELNAGVGFTINDNGNGTYTVNPPTNYNGPVNLTYKVSDGIAAVDATQTFTLTAVNDAPIASNATITIDEDADPAITQDLPHATDADNDTITYGITSQPLYGVVTLNASEGSYTYVPQNNFNGQDSFEYSVDDGNGGVNTYAITVNVTPVNDAPIADHDSITVVEDTLETQGLPVATDAENDTITYAITIQPSHGTLRLNVSEGSYTYEYEPQNNFNGPDSFEYSVDDGNGGVKTYTIHIDVTPVNDAPKLTGIPEILADGYEDIPYIVRVADLLRGYTDADTNDILTVENLSSSGIFTIVDEGDGTYTIRAPSNYNTIDKVELSYQVTDGIESISVLKTFALIPVNDRPTSADSATTLIEGETYTFTTDDFPFTDLEDNTLQAVKITNLPTHGTLQLDGVAIAAGDVIDAADIASGLLTFVPTDANDNGDDYGNFTFQVQDDGGTANGGIDLSEEHTFTIDVTPVNDAPTGTSATLTIAEDTPYAFTSADFGFSDVDEGDLFGGVKITSLPLNGTLTLDEVAVQLNDFIDASDIVAGKLVFTPASNAYADNYTSFNFKVADNSGALNDLDTTSKTITFSVTPVNDPPELTGTPTDFENGREDTLYTISKGELLQGYTDAESDTLSISGDVTSDVPGTLITYNNVTQTYTIAAPLNYSGPIQLSYLVSDGTDSTLASQSFTLDPVNDAPTGTATATLVSAAEDQDSGYTINVSSLLEGFSDPDLDSLDVTILVARDEDNNQFDVVRDGDTYTIALPENFNGTVSISYDVTDGIDITSASQSFNVTAVNDASTSFDVSVSTLEDIPYIIQTLDFTFSDDEGDNLQAVKITSLPTKGTLRFNGVAFTAGTVISIGDIALGKLVFEPTPNENGVAYANFTFQLQDDGGTANGGINLSPEKTFTIDVIAVNDAPKLTGEKATLIDGSEGDSYTITTSQLLTGYTDAEGDTLSILDLDAGVGFTIDDNGDGTYTVNPPTNYNGPVNLTYQVSDGTTSTASTQTFTLIATNDGGGGTDKSSLATLSRKNILNDVFEINKRVDTLLNARDFYDTTNDAYQAYENSVVLNKLNAIQAGLSNIKLADTDELFFVGMSGGLAKEPSGEANKDVSQKDSIAVIKDKIFRNAETPPTPITDSKGRIIYQLPETIFKGAQGVIKLAATSKDGSPLPDWIKFDSKTGKLTAEVPKDVKSPIEIKIEAVDTRGHKAETTLKILPRPNNMSLSGKHSLSSQFKSAFDLIA